MAKRKAIPRDISVTLEQIEQASHNGVVPDYFTNSVGKRVYCNPVAHDYLERVIASIEKDYRERGEPIDAPTYSYEADGGITVIEEHNETTLQTDEDRAAWESHRDAVQRLNQEQSETSIKALVLRGVNFEKYQEEFEAWKDEEGFIRRLPTSEGEQRYEFARTSLVVTKLDLGLGTDNEYMGDASKLTETCIMLAFKGASKEQVAEARRLFRSSMADAGRQLAENRGPAVSE